MHNNYAFIDNQNLYLSIKQNDWQVDMQRFKVYLKEKYKVTKAFIFIGHTEENQKFYNKLQKYNYIIIFKPTLKYADQKIKGNCDAELVLQTMIEINNFDKAIIVSGDGDFYCLIKYLINQNKLDKVLIPNEFRYSALLKSLNNPNQNVFDFLNRKKDKLEYK